MLRLQLLFCLDVALLLSVVPLQEPRTTGLPAHEWIGIALGALVVLHLLLNWRWIVTAIRRLVSGEGPRRTRLGVVLNVVLFVTMTLTVFSSLIFFA